MDLKNKRNKKINQKVTEGETMLRGTAQVLFKRKFIAVETLK